jgi:hypothetical protein
MANHMGSILRSYFFNLLHNTIMEEERHFKELFLSNQIAYIKMLDSISECIRICKIEKEYLILADKIDEAVLNLSKSASDYDLSK